MSTHDYVIANASGSSVRSDLNNALAAIVSNNSSSSEPSTKYAYMLWVDSTNNLIKLRNSANNAWITLFTTAGGLDVDAASNFNEDVIFYGASANVTWDKSADDLIFNDNAKAAFGTSSDLQIYHDGSHSYIKDTGTGQLVLCTDSFRVNNAANGENIITAEENGAVNLFYNDSKKLETYSSGVKTYGGYLRIVGDEGGTAEINLYADEGDDAYDVWQVKAGGASDFYIAGWNGGSYETSIKATGNGAVELYFDGAKHFETTASGTKASGHFLSERAATAMKVNMTSTGDLIGCIMRHARGGLSGYSGKMISFQGNDDTEEGSIVIGTTSTAFNESSDYRLKENEVAISDGITRLKTLKPYRFNFKKDKDTTVDGFFAHEVTPAVPEAITGAKDAMAAETRYEEGDTIPSGKVVGDPKTFSSTKIEPQQIDKAKLVPLLTAALQEAITKIETLEAKVAALEAK